MSDFIFPIFWVASIPLQQKNYKENQDVLFIVQIG